MTLEQTPHRALRFLTAGSVDDGKSTLIGRLLYDSRAILADQLDTLQKRAVGDQIDLSLLTDGLEAEREQGITIDVAYRYFATKQRKFIIADAPGHEQYTRNMVTAAAGSDAAVVLVDITKLDTSARPVQLLPQTRRHALLAHLLRVPSIVFAVNKLDAVAQPQAAYEAVRNALLDFAERAGVQVAGIIPVSALRGDNVTQPLDAPWYQGPSLLQLLESLPTTQERKTGNLLIPVQYVAREGEGTGNQPRTLWGRIAHGQVRAGDTVQIFPSGEIATVAEVRRAGSVVDSCSAGESAGIVLDRQLDVSRGDWIATPHSVQATQRFSATLAWLDTEPAVVGRKYWVRHGNRWVQARIAAIESRLDIHTLQATEAQELAVNDIGHVIVETQQPLPVEPYEDNRVGGALIIVDPASNRTSGALLVKAAA
ncbi:sulfate adenylyltransferase [Caldimonas thermodepolymerans]|jgi:sulfate adenylyltransferase, large subunit|uniref:sulfate adenylyltransferase n=1 Tax=Caldimonas thermodepolymerans TaxID=215580 RepID=A0A2S5T7B9_9BURK|nr:GTP-binding protein [Caldimonas thermodepolymerans]PPE70757.1 sulfate adenylyltransferase [Caldimonas thermodepolymerans]QPC32972.1 sulfate adenylyltransferase [Caldimonas thermodepolymerans]RDI03755.1 sulfate adenylyltransferase subunit 1 [Caldimonas thermodepolymerans]TCP09722.1 sulfate adenylyltransferase subunit 1 [Caldimonas thermodepolymerans]UZG49734.1 GTP-binding protein [Caldimonas thermodepolymerans]